MKLFNFFKPLTSKIFILILLLLSFVLVSAFSYANTISYNISNNIFRLHVIANSDSEKDQSLKYLVRDAIIEYMNDLTQNISSKEEALNLANDNINKFYEIANNVISENGYDYPVNITIGKYDFPTKSYGDISLPAGNYDALRIEIGSASGRNWWCVMFPPLCFIDISSGIVPEGSKELLKDNMFNESYDLISSISNNSEPSFKFKIVEFIESIT